MFKEHTPTFVSTDTRVPYASGAVNEFRDLFWKARDEVVRIAIIGDSKVTNAGNGSFWMPAINAAATDYFGLAPEIGLIPAGESYSTLPPPRFCHSTTFNTSNGTRVVGADRLPSAASYLTTTQFGSSTDYIRPRAEGRLDARNREYFDLGNGNVTYEAIFARNSTGPSEARITQFFLNQPSGALGTNLIEEWISTGLGLNSSDEGFVTFQTGPIQSPPDGQFAAFGNNNFGVHTTGIGSHMVASRVIDQSKTSGMVFNSFSAGGYTTDLFLQDHSDAGPHLNALGPWDAIFVPMGANHIRQTEQEYNDSFQLFIDTIRGPDWTNNPDQLIVPITSDFRTLVGTGNTQADVDRLNNEFPGVQRDVALANDHVCSFNMNRFGEESVFSQGRLLSDGVHFDGSGQRTNADLFMASWQRVASGLE